jgi:WD40 repeat protein
VRAKIASVLTTFALATAMTAAIQAPSASATTATGAARAQLTLAAATRPNVSSTALSSWQTDGTVFALAYANGVVYAGGVFANARPPGEAAGTTTGEVPRTFLAAFNSTTGALITSFDPVITSTSTPPTAGVFSLAVSPDGSTLYVGGYFDHVNGVYRDSLAAFNTSTGALTSWDPAATSKVDAIAVSPNGSEVYLGGNFSHLDGVARTYAGAVSSAGVGALEPWAPVLNSTVYTLAVDPDDSQVLIGGYFQTINGVTQNAAGAVDPVTGTVNVPWGANIVPWNPGTCTSTVKNIVISGGTAYVAAEGNGGGCFDGDFAVSLGSTDSLVWQNDCLGATQALEVINGYLFKGSHAHDCAYAPGGFPQVKVGRGWATWHLLDQSLTNGTLGHWTPNTNVGSTDAGVQNLGPHAMATDGSQLFVGGDFTRVNNVPQQGFAIFPSGTETAKPAPPRAPTVTSTAHGVASVTFDAVSTPEIGTLTYAIYRSGRRAPVGTVRGNSWPWALPVLHYREAGLRPKSRYTFKVTVSDGTRTSAKSPPSAPVIIASRNPAHTYSWTVLHSKPSFFWQLDQLSGRIAADSSPHHFKGIYGPGTTKGVPGPIPGVRATAFNGVSGLVTAAKKVLSPRSFTIEGWFRTSTDDGGKLIGFGDSQTGRSTRYDRQIYMMNDGQLVFGIYDGHLETIESPNVYNDGHWHYIVATFEGSAPHRGMRLYVDGRLIGTRKTGQDHSYRGYWRVGGDNLNGWNLDPWGSNSQGTTQPASYYFSGTIGDVAVYPTALSAAQVAAHYAANALGH